MVIRITTAIMLIAGLLVLPLIAVGCGSELKDEEAARVNGRPVLRSELFAYASQLAAEEKRADDPSGEAARQLEDRALEDLIVEALILDEAAKREITASDEEIDAKIAQIKKQNFNDDGAKFEEAIFSQGLTADEMRIRVVNGIIMDKLYLEIVREAGEVPDADVETYYASGQESLSVEEQRRLSHILVDSEAEARGARARLDKGEDFAVVAGEVSRDLSTSSKGGDLGWIGKGSTAPAFDNAAFSLKEGQVSDPVQTASGWNIIRVMEIKAGGVPPLDEIREELREDLAADRSEQAWNEWLKKKRKDAEVDYAPEFRAPAAKGELPAGHP